jgi:hypothetical protein
MCENGAEEKTYLDGILVHNAFTRKPANPRTVVEVEKMAEEIVTRQDDAQSIVGEDLAQELEVNKSTTTDELPLVVKSEEPVAEKAFPPMSDDEDLDEGSHPADCECKACMSKKKKPMAEKSALDIAYDNLKSRVTELKSVNRDEAVRELQGEFEKLAETLKSEFPEPAPVPVVEAKIDPALAELLTAIKSSVEKTNDTVSKHSEEVAIFKSAAKVQVAPAQETPAPRNLQVERTIVKPAAPGNPMSIAELARKSVGLS